ncbi:FAD binding domain-containing protein [Myceligenerans xiligouense]|uniref:Carbon-monoxide dehydrogenase medium subunit n=1 Tax=Myceligenerans xiligouense TaxID=253184 RepID=A0A3N4Z7G9_9MICO|nr:xanthine dehydrogenase family protein subunit M [Myceligenerans xiligouense]RPF21788.1 carbon-monoxide dehydrogenase medium subunit [Myceligenerans xiligouense]
MIPAPFEYARPTSVDEALSLLAESDDAKVIAGGQSLLPVLRMRLGAPELVVDIGRIDTLRGIREVSSTDPVAGGGGAIEIGAMTPYHEILASSRVRGELGLLHDAVSQVGDPQIRHLGTLGGSLAHADPAGDCGAVALALEAEMVVAGPAGERVVPAADFFQDLFTTAVGEDELLVAVRFPVHPGWGHRYEKFVRIAQQWPIVAVGACVHMADGKTITEARIGLTNMGPTPLRARAVEEALVGVTPTPEAVAAACASAADGTSPPSDLNGDADYRRHLVTVLARRAVLAAAGAA